MNPAAHKQRIAVLRGGISDEAALSMQNGQTIIELLSAQSRYEVMDIIINGDSEWLVYGIAKTPTQALQHIDLVVIALHGIYGEDGTVQRILERHGVPYVGSNPYASAIGMHKMLAKEYVAPLGITTAPHMQVSADASNDWSSIAYTIQTLFGPEYVIKPMRSGSSIGVTYVDSLDALVQALRTMTKQYGDVLVEQYIPGTDITIGVVEDLRGVPYYTTPLIEVVATHGVIHDVFAAEKIAPGRLHQAVRDTISQHAVAIHNELAMKDFSRSDWRVTPEGEIYFLEINSLPAVTKDSPLMTGLASVGVTEEELFDQLLVQQ